ncbi:CLUMA_CG005986, isoform A [Clunio marinus]|uniref:CLUMA_CG005986, isoform A n=1 Tax=Clunio marinus TaxID=568069 RepID=A0A1J1HWM8_9DIPT|nr:CLUMA_CG005986, isoform A [Clunio marinus]
MATLKQTSRNVTQKKKQECCVQVRKISKHRMKRKMLQFLNSLIIIEKLLLECTLDLESGQFNITEPQLTTTA